MAATATTPFAGQLAQLKLTLSDAELQPGELCAASLTGLSPRGIAATVEWSVQSLPDGAALAAGTGFLAPEG